jgi:hypothetical protein
MNTYKIFIGKPKDVNNSKTLNGALKDNTERDFFNETGST